MPDHLNRYPMPESVSLHPTFFRLLLKLPKDYPAHRLEDSRMNGRREGVIATRFASTSLLALHGGADAGR